jgi:hypothetical protein
MKMTPEQLFLQGKFKKIVAQHELHSRTQPDPYTLGAYVFVGRHEDAEILFEKWKKKYSADQQLMICFFLSIGWIRSSRFPEGRKYLALCFSLRHQIQNSESRVFLFQAFGFYHYFICRYRNSAYWAQKAWRASVLTDSDLGQILSSDLLAHALFQRGEIEKGFSQMEKAILLAQKFGQGGLVKGFEVSRLCFEAQFGTKPAQILSLLQTKYKEVDEVNDTYSKTNLGLEWTRQLLIRGQVLKAWKLLQEIQTEVFKFGHRRQKSTWYFRLSYLEWMRGDVPKALARLDSALAELDSKHDLAHRLQALGFQCQIQESQMSPEAFGEIKSLTRQVGSSTSSRYLDRLLKKSKSRTGEDRIGELVDEICFEKRSTLEITQRICELGYFQLLRPQFSKPNRRQILMDVLPNDLLTFSDGQIEHRSRVLTPLMQRILLFLRTGPKDKKELLEGLWGYQYDPLRHDPLVFTAIARLRKALGNAQGWLKLENEKYRLENGVQVQMYEHNQALPKTPASEDLIDTAKNRHDLNYRQIKLMNELRVRNTLSIRECMKILDATKITANRDVKDLFEKGLIQKSGHGKSTRYH